MRQIRDCAREGQPWAMDSTAGITVPTEAGTKTGSSILAWG